MTPKALLLLVDDGGWRVGITDGQADIITPVDLPEDPTPTEIAQAIIDHLSHRQGDSSGQGSNSPRKIPDTVVLGLPSNWCLCGTVTVPDLPPRQRRTAMTYGLEAKLPISVDSTVVDFIVTDDAALGIAVQTDRVRELVTTLEDLGLKIDYICPTPLLAFQSSTTSDTSPGAPIAWRDRTGLNLLELDPEDRLIHWRWLPGHTENNTTTEPSATENLSDAERVWVESCRQSDNDSIRMIHEGMAESALKTTEDIQSGRIEPLVNFRRDALDVSDRFRRVHWHMNTVMASAAVLLLALTGVFLWRAHGYKQADLQYDTAISKLFQDTYGDQPQPISVRRRLSTRLRELQGLAGQQFDEVESTEKVSALWLLHDLLERIPSDQRVCLLTIKIEHDYISIDGQARSHSDADRIAAALRGGGRFEVDPPSTSNLKDGGVSFSLHCIPIDNTVTTPPNAPHNTKPTSRVVTTGEALP